MTSDFSINYLWPLCDPDAQKVNMDAKNLKIMTQ